MATEPNNIDANYQFIQWPRLAAWPSWSDPSQLEGHAANLGHCTVIGFSGQLGSVATWFTQFTPSGELGGFPMTAVNYWMGL